MTPNHSWAPDDEGLPRRFFAILVVLAGMFGGVTTWDLWKARREATQQANAASRNIALLTAHEIARTIELFDHAIQKAVFALSLPGLDAATPEVRQHAVFTAPTYASHLGVMLFTDAAGRVVMESGSLTPRYPDVSQRLYFTEHVHQAGRGLLITPPFTARTTSSEMIGLSRRYDRPDGSFGGVVMGAIEVSYFRDLIANLVLEDGASVKIATDSGLVLAQSQWPPQKAVGRRTKFPAQNAGVQQSARAANLPIQVDVTIPFPTVYAAWERNAMIVGGANFVLVITLMVVARGASLELRRRRAAELSAAAFAENYRILTDSTADVIMRLDLDGTLRYASPATRKVLGCDPADMCGRSWRNYVDPQDWALLTDAMQQLRRGTEEVNATYRSTHNNGTQLWLEARMRLLNRPQSGTPPQVIATLRDVTWQHTHAEQLSVLAATDGLTGVANRRRFDEWLDTQWCVAGRSSFAVSLILLDVDAFKLYNDCYGHVGGDAVLRLIADCMRAEIRRPADLAARYGGEEFAVLLPDTDPAEALRIAEKIRLAVASRAIAHERSAHGCVTISAGVASVNPLSEPDAARLVTRADLALYEAKRLGRNKVVTYGEELAEKAA